MDPFPRTGQRGVFERGRARIETDAGDAGRLPRRSAARVLRPRGAAPQPALGRPRLGLLRGLCDVELPDHAAAAHPRRRRGERGRCLGGGGRELAAPRGQLPRGPRHALAPPELLLRRAGPPAPPRLRRRGGRGMGQGGALLRRPRAGGRPRLPDPPLGPPDPPGQPLAALPDPGLARALSASPLDRRAGRIAGGPLPWLQSVEPPLDHRQGQVVMPREPQDRRAPARGGPALAPRPSRLDAPITALRGAGPQLAAAAAELGIETLGDLLLHVPHSYRDRSRAPPAVGARDRRAGDGRGRGPLGAPAADPPARPDDRRGDGGGRVRARRRRSGSTRPGWPSACASGTRLLLYGKLDRSGFRVEAHEFLPAGAATRGAPAPPPGPPHDGHRPRASRLGAAARPAAARVGVAGAAAGAPRARAAAGGASRPPPPGGRRRCAGDRPLSGQPRRGRAGSGSARLRGALPAPGGARRAPPGSPGEPAGHRPGRARRAGRALARLAALRAHRRSAARDRGDRRRPGVRAPHAAPADGRGRVREDGRRRVRDAARGRGGLPGGADGAHRDARRAARRDPRPAARRLSRSPSRC